MSLRHRSPQVATLVVLGLMLLFATEVKAKYQYQFPLTGSTKINRETSIIVRPGDVLDAKSVNASYFIVTGSGSGKHTGTLVLSDDRKTLTFRPKTSFAFGERVTVQIVKGIKNSKGAYIETSSFFFTIVARQKESLSSSVNSEAEETTSSTLQTEPTVAAKSTDEIEPAHDFELTQNFPNPFNPTTTIRFYLAEPGRAAIELRDGAGHMVATIVDAVLDAGKHEVFFDAGTLAAGAYYYTLRSGTYRETRTMIVAK
jgi:hypothetical protein